MNGAWAGFATGGICAIVITIFTIIIALYENAYIAHVGRALIPVDIIIFIAEVIIVATIPVEVK